MIPLLLALALTSLVWCAAALVIRRAGARALEPGATFDAIVVLGCRVRPDGSPGLAFARRIELGCALLREGRAPRLVVTGGAVGGPIPEADAARTYIEARALCDLAPLVLEREARNTRENARRTRALLGDVRVLVVTDAWHVPRARRIFARAFGDVQCAGAPGRFRGALREVPAFVFDLVRGG